MCAVIHILMVALVLGSSPQVLPADSILEPPQKITVEVPAEGLESTAGDVIGKHCTLLEVAIGSPVEARGGCKGSARIRVVDPTVDERRSKEKI